MYKSDGIKSIKFALDSKFQMQAIARVQQTATMFEICWRGGAKDTPSSRADRRAAGWKRTIGNGVSAIDPPKIDKPLTRRVIRA